VRAGFRARAAAEPQRFRVIDAAQPPASVGAAVDDAIGAYLRTLTDSDLA
jgi:dTMP kinase